jgi:hypothetical protein
MGLAARRRIFSDPGVIGCGATIDLLWYQQGKFGIAGDK